MSKNLKLPEFEILRVEEIWSVPFGGPMRRERAFARLRGTRPKGKFSLSCVALFDWSAARSARRSGAEWANRGEASTRRLRTISPGEKTGEGTGPPKKRETPDIPN